MSKMRSGGSEGIKKTAEITAQTVNGIEYFNVSKEISFSNTTKSLYHIWIRNAIIILFFERNIKMSEKSKDINYGDCVHMVCGVCKTLKDTYCKKEPHKACSWYKSRQDTDADKSFGRCGSCKRRKGFICTVQEKRISAYKFCDCGEFVR